MADLNKTLASSHDTADDKLTIQISCNAGTSTMRISVPTVLSCAPCTLEFKIDDIICLHCGKKALESTAPVDEPGSKSVSVTGNETTSSEAAASEGDVKSAATVICTTPQGLTTAGDHTSTEAAASNAVTNATNITHESTSIAKDPTFSGENTIGPTTETSTRENTGVVIDDPKMPPAYASTSGDDQPPGEVSRKRATSISSREQAVPHGSRQTQVTSMF
ncbi:hypothetical protein F5Y15DRAFT_243728 [Xylariaceae sp. FL0016]|nr:hypothetical protein F5Y15DRAFT_243728 [Xylariaceae sp. FL0016]